MSRHGLDHSRYLTEDGHQNFVRTEEQLMDKIIRFEDGSSLEISAGILDPGNMATNAYRKLLKFLDYQLIDLDEFEDDDEDLDELDEEDLDDLDEEDLDDLDDEDLDDLVFVELDDESWVDEEDLEMNWE
jgi:hypothetical protein